MTLHTFVGQVHEKGGADVSAGDKVLVRKHRYFVEAFKNDVRREISETGVVHKEEGILSSAFELPLSLDRCSCEIDNTTVRHEWVQSRLDGAWKQQCARFRSQTPVHLFCALGGDDDIFLDLTFLRGVIGHAEGEAKSVEFALKMGLINVPIDPQFSCFTVDFTVCSHLLIERELSDQTRIGMETYEISRNKSNTANLNRNEWIPVDPFPGYLTD